MISRRRFCAAVAGLFCGAKAPKLEKIDTEWHTDVWDITKPQGLVMSPLEHGWYCEFANDWWLEYPDGRWEPPLDSLLGPKEQDVLMSGSVQEGKFS